MWNSRTNSKSGTGTDAFAACVLVKMRQNEERKRKNSAPVPPPSRGVSVTIAPAAVYNTTQSKSTYDQDDIPARKTATGFSSFQGMIHSSEKSGRKTLVRSNATFQSLDDELVTRTNLNVLRTSSELDTEVDISSPDGTNNNLSRNTLAVSASMPTSRVSTEAREEFVGIDTKVPDVYTLCRTELLNQSFGFTPRLSMSEKDATAQWSKLQDASSLQCPTSFSNKSCDARFVSADLQKDTTALCPASKHKAGSVTSSPKGPDTFSSSSFVTAPPSQAGSIDVELDDDDDVDWEWTNGSSSENDSSSTGSSEGLELTESVAVAEEEESCKADEENPWIRFSFMEQCKDSDSSKDGDTQAKNRPDLATTAKERSSVNHNQTKLPLADVRKYVTICEQLEFQNESKTRKTTLTSNINRRGFSRDTYPKIREGQKALSVHDSVAKTPSGRVSPNLEKARKHYLQHTSMQHHPFGRHRTYEFLFEQPNEKSLYRQEEIKSTTLCVWILFCSFITFVALFIVLASELNQRK